jgi:two-component system LytT family response regulator
MLVQELEELQPFERGSLGGGFVKIRTLIVDDEPLARERLRALLSAEPDIEVIGECGDGPAAVQAIRSDTPDLVFLDVQIPEIDGFGVIERIGVENAPVVVFVTAYDQYALEAFDVHAVDYLLKPFDEARFAKALARARGTVQSQRNGEVNERLLTLLRGIKTAPSGRAERLVVKSAGRLFFLRAEEIDWIESSGNYVCLHVGNETHLLRETMSSLEARLDPNSFIRIHRTAIVNVDRIKELQPLFHGEYEVVLRGGARLTLSRSYRDRLQCLLGKDL